VLIYYQFGFSTLHSAAEQMNRVVNHDFEDIETKKYSCGVF